jgi:perosamine synthetase
MNRQNIHIPVTAPNFVGNELKYLSDAFLSNWVSSTGKYIDKFEKDFSRYCGCKHGVAVSNGTVALHMALVALGIQRNDEIIVPDLTFAATINAVLHANATPVIVDVEKESWCIDPCEIERSVTSQTKAIIPVHLYGQPCNMEEIMRIAQKHNLFIIEDCAEAHGAKFSGKKVGSFGHIGCFSFYGNKVITTGEGGMCVTNSDELNNRMRILRDHGMSKNKKYWHEHIGYNYRMTNLQAALGVAQVERIDDILNERKQIENQYKERLSGIEGIEFQPSTIPKREKITWIVSILLKKGKRDEYMERLKKEGIDNRPFFCSLSSMPIYERYVFSNQNSLSLSRMGINLPTIKNLDDDFFDKVVAILRI